MRIMPEGNNLLVSEIEKINASNASAFFDEVFFSMPKRPELVEFDLSRTQIIDDEGVFVLDDLRRAAIRRNRVVVVRLSNPKITLTHMITMSLLRDFQIVHPTI